MPLDIIPFSGWEKNLRLANASAELIISLEIGPRILSYRPQGGSNIFHNYSAQLGGTGEAKWMNRGGHRLWIAPESEDLSYQLDNEPFPYEMLGEKSVKLTTPGKGAWLIRKELTVSLAENGSGVSLTHALVNDGPEPRHVAPWALSVMRPGGLSFLPQPPLGEHPRDLLPDRALVLWPYTDLTDARLHLGKKFISLRQEADSAPIKFGLAHRGGWAAYLSEDQLFIKTVPWVSGATYPDLGCNYESFTDEDMLEVETLGPLTLLAPGETISHCEQWSLFGGLTPPPFADSSAFADWLHPYLPSV